MNKVNAFGLSALVGVLVMFTAGQNMSKTVLLTIISILLIAILVVTTVYFLYTLTKH
jgi:hypothetical protein